MLFVFRILSIVLTFLLSKLLGTRYNKYATLIQDMKDLLKP